MAFDRFPSSEYCPLEATTVCLEQTEGQCRDAHGCERQECPLSAQFRGRAGHEDFCSVATGMAALFLMPGGTSRFN